MAGEILRNNSRYTLVFVVLDGHCQLVCKHCYAKGIEKKVMSLETARMAVNFIKDLSTKCLILSGGDPTMNPNFCEIVNLFLLAKARVHLNTNAISFADKHLLDKIIHPERIIFDISMKAATKESFVKQTQVDLFEEQMLGIKNIINSGAYSVLSMTLSRNMLEEFDEIIKIGKALNFGSFLISFAFPAYVDGVTSTDGMMTPSEMAIFISEKYRQMKKLGTNFIFRMPIPFCLFPEDFLPIIKNDFRIMTNCSMKNGSEIVISQDGSIFPCNNFYFPALGKLKEDFKTAREFEIFKRKKEIVSFYKKINSFAPRKECFECDYYFRCRGGCPLLWQHYGEKMFIN